jgi:hypothetical protein
MTINFDTIPNNYEAIYVIKTVMKYYLKKLDTSFHQCLPNMIQRLFADVITILIINFGICVKSNVSFSSHYIEASLHMQGLEEESL